MTYEMRILLWACVLGLVHLMAGPQVAAAPKGYGKWNIGPRDMPFDQGVVAERLQRAFANFRETFLFFAVAVLALAILHKSSDLSIWGARIYLLARIIYLPLYAFGISVWRSLAFVTSFVGLCLCLWTALT